ncbi:MAG: nucleotidyltransferase domain-containing protein [Peptococcaceae bacterium]|nr:nucleotidyltransferase domain-containing protein [Peptococcaceae bacterium]
MLTQYRIREIVKEIAPQYGIKQVYLFGSYARGDATEESDVDIRVVGGNIPTLFELGGLYEDLIESLGRRVDVVLTKNIKSGFYDVIRDEEVLIYDGK